MLIGAKSAVRLKGSFSYMTETITACDVTITSVWPSGAAFAAISAPMMPLAPGRVSTMTC